MADLERLIGAVIEIENGEAAMGEAALGMERGRLAIVIQPKAGCIGAAVGDAGAHGLELRIGDVEAIVPGDDAGEAAHGGESTVASC